MKKVTAIIFTLLVLIACSTEKTETVKMGSKDSDLLEIEQDAHILRVERANNFALSCELDEAQVVYSLLGAERCWWDGQQWHFWVRLPDGLSIEHLFSVSEDSRSLAQRTVLAAPGVNRDLEVVRIYSRYDPLTRGFRCTETLSRGRV